MRLLFLCTHNACRSILCEVITHSRAADRIEVASAGSQPSGKVHPAWLGAAAKAHWGLPDPSRHKGSDEEIDAAFRQVARTIAIRIDALLQEEFEGAQTAELTEQLSRIGALN